MGFSRETENKLQWQADVERVSFKLYIPKWRVPQPWPLHILVRVDGLPEEPIHYEQVTPSAARLGGSSLERAIIAIVDRLRDHSETVRFDPRGDPQDWEIGEPYIPYVLLPNLSVPRLSIQVKWDRSGKAWPGD
jgi:hypothetical protein